MSAWADYLAEKQQIDSFVDNGCSIVGVREHLNGMDVQFRSVTGTEQLLIMTADARKYVSGLIIAQQKNA